MKTNKLFEKFVSENPQRYFGNPIGIMIDREIFEAGQVSVLDQFKIFETLLFHYVDNTYGIESVQGNEIYQQLMNEFIRVNEKYESRTLHETN